MIYGEGDRSCIYKYYEGGFAVKHRKDGFKASLSEVLLGYKYCVAFLG